MIEHINDHPNIRFGQNDGAIVHCPWCGEECDTFFKDKFGTIIGCENCVTEVDAYDWVQHHG